MHTPLRSRVRRRLVALPALVVTLVLVVSPSGPATADPGDLGTAKAKAQRLAVQVEELELKVEVAGERLAGARDELGRVVSREVSANQELAELSQTAQRSRAATNERVRALYMSGGEAGLYASVLDGGSLLDVFGRLDAVDRVLERDRATAAADAQAVAEATRLQSELTVLSARQTELEATASEAEHEVRALLEQHRTALADAGAEVRRLTAELQAARAAAAAEAAALRLGVSGPLPTELPPPGTPAGDALRAADSVRGVPYVYAGNGPASFDCSGLTVWSYAHAGIALPRTSRQQWWVGPHPALSELQPGDLLFWAYDVNNPATIHHVALYVGDGWMIHAPHTGDVVRYARVYLDGYIGATRPSV